MSKQYEIKHGQETVGYGEGLEYHGEWLGHAYCTLTVKSATPIAFSVGDYITYRGETFYLWNDKNIKKQARPGSYGEAFVYENVKFYGVSILLEQLTFRDYVLYPNSQANTLVYSQAGKFTFYAQSVEDLADRIQANIGRYKDGQGHSTLAIGGTAYTFYVVTPSSIRTVQRGVAQAAWNKYIGTAVDGGKTEIQESVDGETLWATVGRSYKDFGLSFYCAAEGTTVYVVIGAPAISFTRPNGVRFQYGKGNGLQMIECTADDTQRVVTQIYGYGSTQNLPLNYYANLGRRAFTRGTGSTFEESGVTRYDVYALVRWVGVKKSMNDGDYCTLTYETQSGDISVLSHAVQNGDQTRFIIEPYDNHLDRDFYEAITAGDAKNVKIYVDGGININAWPSSSDSYGVEEPQGYNYPLALSIVNLMLPGFPEMSLEAWVTSRSTDSSLTQAERDHYTALLAEFDFSEDQHAPWIRVKNSDFGIREGDIYFDGSGDNDEIYPTIENTGANKVYGISGVDDNGHVEKGGSFTMELISSNIDWKDCFRTKTESMVVTMKSGQCVGREFTVDGVTQNNSGRYVLTMSRVQDESGCFVPNTTTNIVANDTFIVTGIQMPKAYVDAASVRLFEATIDALREVCTIQKTYLPKIDEIYMAREHAAAVAAAQEEAEEGETVDPNTAPSLHNKLHAGQLLKVGDTNLGNIESYIDQLTIKDDGNNGIPTYDVVLRDEKEKTLVEVVESQISSSTSSGSTYIPQQGGSSGGGGGGSATGSGELTQRLIVNYNGNVGYLNGNAGITYNEGTPIETVLRNILFREEQARLSVSVSPSQPTAGIPVTLTATFDPGTSGLSVTGWQWYVDGSSTAVEGATDSVFTTAESSGTHTYKVVATLKGGTTMSVTRSVTWQTRQASVTVTVSATEAEVGDTVTVTAAVSLGSTATAVSAITCNGQSMSLSSGTTYTAQPQVQNGANEFEVEVTMNDGTVLTDNVSVTGYYKWFAGKVDAREMSQLSLGDIPTPTNYKFNGTSGNPYTFKIENYRQLAVAVPSEYTIKKIESLASHINLLNNSSEFLKTGTKVLAKSNKQYNVVLFTASRYTGDGVISEFEVSV